MPCAVAEARDMCDSWNSAHSLPPPPPSCFGFPTAEILIPFCICLYPVLCFRCSLCLSAPVFRRLGFGCLGRHLSIRTSPFRLFRHCLSRTLSVGPCVLLSVSLRRCLFEAASKFQCTCLRVFGSLSHSVPDRVMLCLFLSSDCVCMAVRLCVYLPIVCRPGRVCLFLSVSLCVTVSLGLALWIFVSPAACLCLPLPVLHASCLVLGAHTRHRCYRNLAPTRCRPCGGDWGQQQPLSRI